MFRHRGVVLLVLPAVVASLLSIPTRVEALAPVSIELDQTTTNGSEITLPSSSAVNLGVLSSRTKQKQLVKSGTGTYTMTGTDSRSGRTYQFTTLQNYISPQTLREGDDRTGLSGNSLSYFRTFPTSLSDAAGVSKSNVTRLRSIGTINQGNGNTRNNIPSYGSVFGPEIWSKPFAATSGQGVSFEWAAEAGDDDYEIYAFLVKVTAQGTCSSAATADYGTDDSHEILAHGRGTRQQWVTSSGTVSADGCYRFRFVVGTYDQTGGYAVGASLFVANTVLLGQAQLITYPALADQVRSSSSRTLAIGATSNAPGATITYRSLSTGVCSVSGGQVTVLANVTGTCTLRADSPSIDDFTAAPSTYASFQVIAAATAPVNNGGNIVAGDNVSCATLAVQEGSWGTGGQPITATAIQWTRNGSPIAGETSTSYSLTSADVGAVIAYNISKTNSVGTTTASASGVTIIDTRLTGLSVSQGSLSPAFGECQRSFSLTSTAASLTFTPVFASGVTVTMNGAAAVTGVAMTVTLTPGANSVTFAVSNGVKSAIVTVLVTYAAPPAVKALAPTNVAQDGTTVTFQGLATANTSDTATVTFEYDTTSAFDAPVILNPTLTTISGFTETTTTATVSGLSANTRYWYRLRAVSANDNVISNVWSFVTPAAPTVTTSAASGLTVSSAILNGSVNAQNAQTTRLEFELSTAPDFQTNVETVTASPSALSSGVVESVASAPVPNLQPGVRYYFRLVAENINGSNTGDIQSFILESVPGATTGSASKTHNSATLNGTVSWNGRSSSITFVYGTSNLLTSNTTTVAASPSSVTSNGTQVSRIISGLTPSTTYYFRVVATSALGTTEGSIESFRTDADPVPTVSISGPSTTLGTAPITIVFQFSEGVTGFDINDVTLSGATSGWTKRNFQEVGLGGNVYQVELSPATVSAGTLTVTVASGAAKDSANQNNQAASLAITVGQTQVTVSFGGSGFSGALPPAVVGSTNSAIVIPGNVGNVKKTDFKFVGWSTGPDGSGTSYTPGTTVTLSGDTTLFPKFAACAAPSLTPQGQALVAVVTDPTDCHKITVAAPVGSTVLSTVVRIPESATAQAVNYKALTPTSEAALLRGLPTIKLVAEAGASSVTNFLKPISIEFVSSQQFAIPVFSTDGTTWTSLPVISDPDTLGPNDAGYTKTGTGPYTYTLYTRHFTSFGLRETAPTLVISASPSSGFVGNTVQVTSSGGSTNGSMSYASQTPSICTVDSAGLVTGLLTGDCLIDASKAADEQFLAANSQTLTIAFSKQTPPALVLASNSLTLTIGSTLSVTTSGGSLNGIVSYSSQTPLTCSVDAQGIISTVAAGDCVIDASKTADDRYFSSTSQSLTITIVKQLAPQLILTSTSNKEIIGNTIILTVSGGSTNGALTFASNTVDVCTVDSQGIVRGLRAGGCEVFAEKSSDDTYLSSTSSVLVLRFDNPPFPVPYPVWSPTITGVLEVGKVVRCDVPQYQDPVTLWTLWLLSGQSELAKKVARTAAEAFVEVTLASGSSGERVQCRVEATGLGGVWTSSAETNSRIIDRTQVVPATPVSPRVGLLAVDIAFTAGSARVSTSARRSLQRLTLVGVTEAVVVGYARRGATAAELRALPRARASAVAVALRALGYRGKVTIRTAIGTTGTSRDRRVEVRLKR